MRECLKCKKDITGKHESAKFCSTSCRVMYNRKFGKKDTVSKVQVQVLYNQMLAMFENMQNSQPQFKGISEKENGTPTATSHTTKQVLGIEKTFQQLMNLIPDLQYEDEFRRFVAEVEANTMITRKQKDLLLLNMKQSKI